MQLTPEILFGSTLGLIGAALYAFSLVVYRSQKDEITPLAISAIKMWVALPFMALLMLLLIGVTPIVVPILTVVILALSIILGAVVGDTIYLVSQERIGVSYAFPIAMSFPILTFAFTIWFLGEPVILSRLVGVFIAVTGVIMISREQNRASGDDETKMRYDLLGIGLAVLVSILYATATTILQVGIEDVDPIVGNFIRIIFGSIVFIPMVGFATSRGMPRPTKRAAKLVVVAAFFGMAVGSLLYVAAVKYAGAAIASVMGTVAPLFAVPVSVFYLKERLTRMAALGIAFTVIGVVMVIAGF